MSGIFDEGTAVCPKDMCVTKDCDQVKSSQRSLETVLNLGQPREGCLVKKMKKWKTVGYFSMRWIKSRSTMMGITGVQMSE